MFYHFKMSTMYFKYICAKCKISIFLTQMSKQFSNFKGNFILLVPREIYYLIEGFFEKGTVAILHFKKIAGIYLN